MYDYKKTCLTLTFVPLMLASLANYPILQTLWAHSFDDGTYSHAYLIPFVSAYLFYTSINDGKLKLRDAISIPFTALTIFVAIGLIFSVNLEV